MNTDISENEMKLKIDDYDRQITVIDQKIDILKKKLPLMNNTEKNYREIQEQIALLNLDRDSIIEERSRIKWAEKNVEEEIENIYFAFCSIYLY